jgi:hypothetical protein
MRLSSEEEGEELQKINVKCSYNSNVPDKVLMIKVAGAWISSRLKLSLLQN